MQDLHASGIGKNILWIEQIKKWGKPLVIGDQVEATKAKSLITDAIDEMNEEKFLTTGAAKEPLF